MILLFVPLKKYPSIIIKYSYLNDFSKNKNKIMFLKNLLLNEYFVS